MPVDDYGNRADIIVDGDSTNRRTNYGRFNEHYITATIMYIEKQCKALLEEGKHQEATELLFKFYSIVSPLMYEHSMSILPTDQDKLNHTIEAMNEGLRVWIPQHSPNMGSRCIRDLIDNFPLPTSPVTYTTPEGKTVRTRKHVLIGSLYMLSLEKIGDDWGATSIPKRQHHGVPGKLTDTDKHSLPWRDQAFKLVGESENRLFMGVLNPAFVTSLVNFPNSPAMCTEAAESILTAEKPTNIDYALSYRKHIEESTGRSAQYLKHILNTSGIQIVKGDPIR